MNTKNMKNRDFTPEQLERLLDYSVECEENLLPYVSTENICCIDTISRTLNAVKEYGIIPEVYWNGNEEDYRKLLCLLSAGYPAKSLLLAVARQKVSGEITAISKKYHQYTGEMMEYVSRYAGYVILKPSEYMLTVYPSLKDKLFVYTSNVWEHCDATETEDPILIVDASQRNDIPEMIVSFTRR